MSKVIIAFVIDTIESPTAGTEKQLLLLLRHLDRTRFEPYLCCLRPSKWLSTDFDLCPLFVAGIKSFKEPSSFRKVLRLSSFFKKKGIQVVHTYFRDANIAGIVAAKIAGVKIVLSARRNQGYWHTPRELLILKAINLWVTRFVANCQDTARFTHQTEKVPLEKIHVMYNGIDTELFVEDRIKSRTQYRNRLHISDNSPLVGIVANLRPVKGINIFLKAAHLVVQKVPEAKFVVAGEGTEKENLLRIVRESGLSQSVTFLGKVNDISSLLQAMDIGVLSSYSESFSNAIVEYMTFGLPVVCTAVGGNREAITEGENGFVVPCGNYEVMAHRIIRIIMDTDLAREMGKKNRIKAKAMFSSHVMLNSFESFIQDVYTSKLPVEIP
ncbi:MAG: glycosyltransferase [bacterium]